MSDSEEDTAMGKRARAKPSPDADPARLDAALPNVSQGDVEKAKKILEDEKQEKRIRSQMRQDLQQKELYDDYLACPMGERKKHLIRWMAGQLNSTESKKTKNWSGVEKLTTEKKSGYEGGWVSKHWLVTNLGEEKAKNKIAYYRAQGLVRPDPDTKLDDDENAEFKHSADVFSGMEAYHYHFHYHYYCHYPYHYHYHYISLSKADINEMRKKVTEDLDSEAKRKAMEETFASARAEIGMGNMPVLKVKPEAASGSKGPEQTPEAAHEAKGRDPKKDSEKKEIELALEALEKSPKTVPA